jgi:hypothetical protein
MAIARPLNEDRATDGWVLSVEPVGPLSGLFQRLRAISGTGTVVLGVDFPLGLPRAYVTKHLASSGTFPTFLRALAGDASFFEVADELAQVGPGRPFYPRRGIRGMTRLSHAIALGLDTADGLSRACDRATRHRPAGAPLFWTLGANQAGKAAISAWRDLLLPAMAAGEPISLWPFDGPLRTLAQTGGIVVAETYPAEALRQLGLRPVGSKRRQADRLKLVPALRGALVDLNGVAAPELVAMLDEGFGADAAGEDRLDCMLGLLCVMSVMAGRRPDAPPPDPWLTRWEGWVLGQSE